MFSIYENNKKISGACRSYLLCLDYAAISPFVCFNVTLGVLFKKKISQRVLIFLCSHLRGSTASTCTELEHTPTLCIGNTRRSVYVPTLYTSP